MGGRAMLVEVLELPFPRREPAPGCRREPSPLAAFDECPVCGAPMAPEHAHFRCTGCGWRDSCCD